MKLDKGIINNCVTDPVSRSIVKGMVKTGRITGAMCLAEGAEMPEQPEALRESGCDYAQGYYYNKPLVPEEFEQKYLVALA